MINEEFYKGLPSETRLMFAYDERNKKILKAWNEGLDELVEVCKLQNDAYRNPNFVVHKDGEWYNISLIMYKIINNHEFNLGDILPDSVDINNIKTIADKLIKKYNLPVFCRIKSISPLSETNLYDIIE